jgi:hypothetical protein
VYVIMAPIRVSGLRPLRTPCAHQRLYLAVDIRGLGIQLPQHSHGLCHQMAAQQLVVVVVYLAQAAIKIQVGQGRESRLPLSFKTGKLRASM